jgi:hypothetical protein
MESQNGSNSGTINGISVFEIVDGYEGVEGFRGPGWYFWDETETNLIGPFLSSDRANIAQNVYFANI